MASVWSSCLLSALQDGNDTAISAQHGLVSNYQGFKKLSQQWLLKLNFCLFVDSVDEYDGEDFTHVIDVLKDLKASPSVKECLSSRLWNILIAALGAENRQKLLLRDHYRDDIRRYVKDRFEKDEQFTLFQLRGFRSSDLVDKIVQDAQGVFLWVRVVVSNLLRGLSNDDSLSDLHRSIVVVETVGAVMTAEILRSRRE